MSEGANLAIDIRRVSKRFGTTNSLTELSLQVQKGSVIGLLGPNGAGKTTTLRSLLGLVHLDAGSISVFGLNPQTQGREVRWKTGVLLEGDGLYRRLTALQNLDYHGRIWRLHKGERLSRAEQLLRSFDLWERREDRVQTWSKGMRQKLALARALLHRPSLLLLDEPFTGLDPLAAVELRHYIGSLSQQHDVTVVLATHDLVHVEKVCTSVAVIQKGSVIAQGAPDQMRSGTTTEVEVEVKAQNLTAEVLEDMQRDGTITSYRLSIGGALLICTQTRREGLGLEMMKRGVAVEELQTRRNSLEESFLSLISKDDE